MKFWKNQEKKIAKDYKRIVELVKQIKEIYKKEKNYEKYECLKILEVHGSFVYSVIELHDGKEIISGSGNRTINLGARNN